MDGSSSLSDHYDLSARALSDAKTVIIQMFLSGIGIASLLNVKILLVLLDMVSCKVRLSS